MATYEKTALGVRLARVRKEKGFKTAQSLADAIPSEKVTKATIVNIEAGRKSEPSMLEMMQISSALGVPPVYLLLDIEHPFEAVGMGLAEPYSSMSVASYLLATDVKAESLEVGVRTAIGLVRALQTAEEVGRVIRWARDHPGLYEETEEYAPMGPRFGFAATFFDGTKGSVDREMLEPSHFEGLIRAFRISAARLEGAWEAREIAGRETPAAIGDRVTAVVELAGELNWETRRSGGAAENSDQ